LMTDLRGFTTLTRQRSQAGQSELHVRQLNTYLGAMVEVIAAATAARSRSSSATR